MEVEYMLSRREFQQASYRIAMSRAATRTTVYLTPIVAAFAVIAISSVLSIPIAISLVGAIISLLLIVALLPTTIRAQSGKIYDIQSKAPSWSAYTVRIEPDHLAFRSSLVKSEIRWEAVIRISEDADGFYLYVSPIYAYFVPQRVFLNAAEAQQFWALAQSYHQHARKAPLPAAV